MKQILVSALMCSTLIAAPLAADSSGKKSKVSKGKIVAVTTSGSSGEADPGVVAIVGASVIFAVVEFLN